MVWLLAPCCALAQSAAVDYDIVNVRAPRYGDQGYTRWPEVFNSVQREPGADLMLLKPNGREEILFAGGAAAWWIRCPALTLARCIFPIFPICVRKR